MKPVVLEHGRRVFLRHPLAVDASEVLTLVRASRRLHRPWMAPPDSPETYTTYLRSLRGTNRAGFLVCLKSTGQVAGVINMSEIVRGILQSAYLGYYAHAELAGRGYMTDGLQLVVRHAFGSMRLHRLEANIQPANTASLRLAERCGFQCEGYSPRYLKIGGRWRDHERWAIVRG